MDNYFSTISASLSNDDLRVLALLKEEEANMKFKAIKKKTVFNLSGFTEANFRKVIQRLEAIQYISLVTGSKEHKLFITEFGQKALCQSLSKGGII